MDSWVELDFGKPKLEGGKLVGEIFHIDAFGNLISNIDEQQFFSFTRARPFIIRVGEKAIQGLKKGYWEEKKNVPMALFGSGGFLEISIREGNAQKMLKLKKGNQIIVQIGK